MSSALHKRLQRLEELLAARAAPPIWRWSFGDTAEHVVADVPERDRHRVQIWRWLTQEEARARGMELPPDPPAPQPYVPPQLPAPPERKLLSAPPAPPKADEPDDPYTRVRAVPPQPRKPEDKFHWPIIYPKRTGIV